MPASFMKAGPGQIVRQSGSSKAPRTTVPALLQHPSAHSGPSAHTQLASGSGANLHAVMLPVQAISDERAKLSNAFDTSDLLQNDDQGITNRDYSSVILVPSNGYTFERTPTQVGTLLARHGQAQRTSPTGHAAAHGARAVIYIRNQHSCPRRVPRSPCRDRHRKTAKSASRIPAVAQLCHCEHPPELVAVSVGQTAYAARQLVAGRDQRLGCST